MNIHKRYPPELKERAVRMAAEFGLPRKEIARRLNVSQTAVVKMLDRNRARAER